MFNSNGVSLADIAAVTGNNRNNDGMWGDGAWWIVILLIWLGKQRLGRSRWKWQRRGLHRRGYSERV